MKWHEMTWNEMAWMNEKKERKKERKKEGQLERKKESKKERKKERMNGWMNEWMNGWMSEWMNEWMKEGRKEGRKEWWMKYPRLRWWLGFLPLCSILFLVSSAALNSTYDLHMIYICTTYSNWYCLHYLENKKSFMSPQWHSLKLTIW